MNQDNDCVYTPNGAGDQDSASVYTPNGVGDQDSASAPAPQPRSPCPYTRDIWHPIVGGIVLHGPLSY